MRRKNDTLKEIFNCLKKINEKNIILISSKNMLGEDGEATVDGIHFTDLGMMRYADLVCPVIKKAIRWNGVAISLKYSNTINILVFK